MTDKKEEARLRMARIRAERKANETEEEKQARLEKQRLQKVNSRQKIRDDKGLGVPRAKAPPRKVQTYKVNDTDNQNISRVLKLQDDLGGSREELDFDIILDTELVRQHLEEKYDNLNTRRSYYASLVKILRDFTDNEDEAIEFYSTEMTEAKAIVDKQVAENKKTSKEQERWLDWSEVTKVSPANIKNDQQRLIYLLYTNIPPRRTEYRLLQITNATAQQLKNTTSFPGNYIVLTPAGNITRIVLNEYKTVDKYGQFVVPLTKSSTLKTQLKKYITDKGLKAGDYLFPPTLRFESGWSKAVRDTFLEVVGKSLNINMLRKIYVSYINELPPNQRTQKILQEVASAMGTSLDQISGAYTKVDDNDSDDEE
jgi:hypothetical protein